MLVRFWGVRGSAPALARQATRFGFHTACVEVCDEATGALLIVDTGTGLEPLACALGSRPVPVVILLSHVDPVDMRTLAAFPPLVDEGWSVRVVAPAVAGLSAERVRSALRAQVAGPGSDALDRTVISLMHPGQTDIGAFKVRSVATNYPGGALAYRIVGESGDLVYVSGHRFGDIDADETLTSFAFNSGATIFGDDVSDHEREGKTAAVPPWHQATEFASATGAGHLWLFRYGPETSDEALEQLETRARRVYPATRVAREGDTFKL